MIGEILWIIAFAVLCTAILTRGRLPSPLIRRRATTLTDGESTDAPDTLIRAAYLLAERGHSAEWLARTLNLPHAMTTIITTEVAARPKHQH